LISMTVYTGMEIHAKCLTHFEDTSILGCDILSNCK